MASRSISPRASSWCWSGPRAAASRRCCACSPATRRALDVRLKPTRFYVSHDQIGAMTRADRTGVRPDGRIVQLGEPLELYDRPATLFVAQFIGSPAMNVFDGIVKGGAVEALGARWPARGGSEGQKVKYGIRPEHLEPAASGIAAEVIVVEPMGAETELLVKIAETSLTVMTRGRSHAGHGERLFLAPQAVPAHLFDAASGQRITT